MIAIDGSFGEGGGAILRQAMALSTLTQKPFKIINVRSGRPKPGLKAQHLHSIIALEKISGCNVTDCGIGSEKLTFIPGVIKSKSIDIDVGTAGSITLLLQSLILPIIFSKKAVTLKITGGTDVKWSQPVDYLSNVLVPRLRQYADINIMIKRRGYFPKGGGNVVVKIKSNSDITTLKPLDLTRQGLLLQIRGVSHSSLDLEPIKVADRQAENAELLLSDMKVPVSINRHYSKSLSTGSGITLWALFATDDEGTPNIIAGDALGERGKNSKEVGKEAVENLRKELSSGAAVDKYLADQLIPLLALTKGEMKTSEITNHLKSNIYVAEKFLDVKFEIEGNIIRVV